MTECYASAKQTAVLLASHVLSSAELTEAMIQRIELLDTGLNAVVVRDFDRARIAAKAADAALLRGERQPLLGVPITVKESFNVRGLPTNWGVTAFREWKPSAESLAIQRLRQAGAIILGKTNVSEALADWQCCNDIFGRTNNPWNLSRTAGGSSGGSAAAVAAGFSFLEVGSDIAGSIRIPAHFCGVFGHRPTYGLLSTQGYNFPLTCAQSDLSTIGPLGRSAADLAIGFDLLMGPSKHDSLAYSISVPRARHDSLRHFRVLALQEHPLVPSSQDVRRPVIRLTEELRKSGATVATSSPLLPDLAEATKTCLRLLMPLTMARVSDEHYTRMTEQAGKLRPDDGSLAAIGLRAGTGTYREWSIANEKRARLFLQWEILFREYDVVICPVSPTVAFPHDNNPLSCRRLQVDERSISYFDQIAWASLATGCGLPATTVPFGLSDVGLPTGLQIIGPYLEDRTTLCFAELIEQHFGGFTPPAAYKN